MRRWWSSTHAVDLLPVACCRDGPGSRHTRRERWTARQQATGNGCSFVREALLVTRCLLLDHAAPRRPCIVGGRFEQQVTRNERRFTRPARRPGNTEPHGARASWAAASSNEERATLHATRAPSR